MIISSKKKLRFPSNIYMHIPQRLTIAMSNGDINFKCWFKLMNAYLEKYPAGTLMPR